MSQENSAAAAPARSGLANNPWFILVLVCLAQFMVILDATVTNVALPTISKALSFSASDQVWVVNAYALTFGGFLLLGGRAADLFGRQRVFLGGLVVFTVASLVDGLATSPGMLIVARGVQGLGGALISPAALAIITTTFAEGSARTKALGVWSGIAAGGAAFGLLLGGILTQWASWRWVFFVNLPVGILAFALSARFVPDSKVEGQRGFDVAGAVTVTAGLMAVVYAIGQASANGWTSSTVLIWGGIGVGLLVIFGIVESLYAAPLVRLSIFRARSLTVSNLAMFLVASGMFAMFLFLTFFIQYALLYKPIQTGFAFMPFCVGIGIGAGGAQALTKRAGVRACTLIGLVVASVGFFWLTRISIDASYAAVVLPALLIMSVGFGLTFVPITLVATTNVSDDDAGLASGLLNTSQQVGGALGLAVLSTFAASRTASLATHPFDVPALIEGWKLAFACGGGLLLAGGLMVLLFLRGHHVATIDEGLRNGTVEATAAVA